MERFEAEEGIPDVIDVMSPFPHTIDEDCSVREAKEMLARHGVRHLPVVKNGELCGILTERDLKLAQAVSKLDDFDESMSVSGVCVSEFFAVQSNTALNEVLREMVKKRIGSALILRGNDLVGIFTATDACHSFADFLEAERDRLSD